MQTVLSDGTTATTVQVLASSAVVGSCVVEGNVWLIGDGERYIHVRDAATAEVKSKVDLMTDDAIAIARVGPRVWVATGSGKIFIFAFDGILLGVLQASTIPLVTQLFPIGDTAVATVGGSKDFSLWDMSQFTVERTFMGSIPGEMITWICSAHPTHASLLALSTASMRLWLTDGTLLAELAEGGVHALCLTDMSDDSTAIWVAQPGWITIFSVSSTRRTTQFLRSKTIPCATVQQLFSVDPSQVASLDAEGLVTVWNTTSLLPMRSFKIASCVDVPTPFTPRSVTCVPTIERVHVSMWCLGGQRAVVWDDVVTHDVPADGNTTTAVKNMVDMEREEIRYLRRKLKYLESMGTLYRQKIGVLFREKSGASSSSSLSPGRYQTPAYVQAFNEIDTAFSKALDSWDNETKDQEPMPDAASQIAALSVADSMEFTEYWKKKYYQLVEEFGHMRQEHEGLIQMINEEQRHGADSANNAAAGIDGRRAMFLTRVIKEKNDLRERVMQLSDDVMKLRGLLKNQALGLSNGESSLDAIDALRQESYDLRRELQTAHAQLEQMQQTSAEAQSQAKQNQLLKQRVKKLRAELDIAQLQLSESTTVMQNDYQTLLENVHILETKMRHYEADSKTYDVKRAELDLEITTLRTELQQQRQLNEAIQKELSQRERVEQSTLDQLQKELTLMCQSLDDRDARVAELLTQNNGLVDRVKELESMTKHQQNTMQVKDQEIFALQDRLCAIEAVVQDRKTYARAVDELQGRMEMVVEELRHGFTPVQFAANISELEGRISNLFALESQLRQKDDIIAMRDDEIATLKEHCGEVEAKIQEVSSVFSQLPTSVEEVEKLLVEVDEYRRRLGNDAETQEMIQLRVLELSARRKCGTAAPFAFQLLESPAK